QGGLVMPILLQFDYADGSSEEMRIPAEIWRRSPSAVKKLVVTEKDIASVVIDPLQETADVDIENNYYPRRIIPSRIESFKRQGSGSLVGRDIMQDIKTELSSEEDDESGGDEETEQ
ncbi:MAG: aminopeptidase, partial [Pseudomonadota bacterium]|nr:aminopeptidase [Pseudomonadota bacterium]